VVEFRQEHIDYREAKQNMKKVCLFLLSVMLLLALFGCGNNKDPEWKKNVDSIKVGMTFDDVVAVLGKPNANIGSTNALFMYILPDEHVALIAMNRDNSKEGTPLVVNEKPEVYTYEAFKAVYEYTPDDPQAWWNVRRDAQ
jgi:hypothetical protein